MSCLCSVNAKESSLQDQLAAIAQAENEGKVEEKRAEDARKEQERQRANAERVRHERAVAAAAAKERQRRAAELERKAKLEAEIAADKKRDQAYEDQLRQLELENRKLELEAKKARVNRANDFLDQELKERAAQTDVIQSEADARRNLSSGTKELLQSEGKARENKADNWW
ncbi:TPA_asm: hypothetical protein G1R43_11165 [Salmonella enterica subsp. enterica serovar Typhimurium]|uniref:Hydrocephalus-inducing protein Hy-3 n=1 Tax=Salmonella typhimurium TaxID=90371 RepID=A0A5W5ZH01_SALTM|nr:hypothetical protein [Salmonella enterica]EBU6838311.1 hypothetical protein [Salmonella enterica subsp. enterica serovar Typhimurium]EBQ2153539.1 hypothetical protein [Salmonella enterica]EBQ2827186.1 hypothetical protein [Salmonella enterica]EBV5687946.1 hypothetical protein [Salmonella enterica subsp. enterica serovar Typhimurium]